MTLEALRPTEIAIDESSPFTQLSSAYEPGRTPTDTAQSIFSTSYLNFENGYRRGLEEIRRDPSLSPTERASVLKKFSDLTHAFRNNAALQLQEVRVRIEDH